MMIEPKLSDPCFENLSRRVDQCVLWAENTVSFGKAASTLANWYLKHRTAERGHKLILENKGAGLNSFIDFTASNDLPSKLDLGDGLTDISLALDKFFFSRNQQGFDDETEWLVGTALAIACEKRPKNKVTVAAAWKLLATSDIAVEAFFCRIQQLANPHTLKNTIMHIVQLLADEASMLVGESGREQLATSIKEFNEAETIAYVWNCHDFLPVDDSQISIVNTLRHINPRNFLDAIDILGPIPLFTSNLSHYEIKNDFDELINLLSLAPVVLPTEGWNHGISAPILMALTSDFIVRISETYDRLQSDEFNRQQIKELSGYCKRLLDCLGNRTDGNALLINWLPELLRQNARDTLSQNRKACLALILGQTTAELSSSGLSLEQIKQELRPENSANQHHYIPSSTDVFFCALAVNGNDLGNAANADLISSLYIDTLIADSSKLNYLLGKSRQNWQAYWAAKLFSHGSNGPANWFSIWRNELAEIRRTRLHPNYKKDYIHSYADAVHLQVGLLAVDWLIGDENKDLQKATKLWSVLFEASFEAQLTSPTSELTLFLSNLFARLPYLGVSMEFAGKAIHRFGDDLETVSVCILALERNGYDMPELQEWFEAKFDSSLLKKVDDFIEWDRRDGGKRSPLHLTDQIEKALKSIRSQ